MTIEELLQATQFRPGSEERKELYQLRYANNIPLHVEGDLTLPKINPHEKCITGGV